MKHNMTLKEAAYIALSGYGPCTLHTLEEWLHARALFRANQKAAMQQIGLKVGR
jgi:hypothetical protein